MIKNLTDAILDISFLRKRKDNWHLGNGSSYNNLLDQRNTTRQLIVQVI